MLPILYRWDAIIEMEEGGTPPLDAFFRHGYKDTAHFTAKPPSPPPIGGGLGGPQVMMAVLFEAKNSTATTKFAEGPGETPFRYPKTDCYEPYRFSNGLSPKNSKCLVVAVEGIIVKKVCNLPPLFTMVSVVLETLPCPP